MSDSYCVALIFFSFKISMEDFYYYHRTISPTEAYAQVNWNSAWCYFCVLLTEVWYTWMTVSPRTWSWGEQESTMSPKLKLWPAFFQETWHQQPPPGHRTSSFFFRERIHPAFIESEWEQTPIQIGSGIPTLHQARASAKLTICEGELGGQGI